MKLESISPRLIEEANKIAEIDQAVYDLLTYWFEAACVMDDRDDILKALRKSIDDYKRYW